MPKVVACPGCGAGYEVRAGAAGVRFTCGACVESAVRGLRNLCATADWSLVEATDAPEDGSAWVEPESKWRVIRGGSWYPGANFARSGYRAKSSSFGRSDMTGFRPAADLPR